MRYVPAEDIAAILGPEENMAADRESRSENRYRGSHPTLPELFDR